MNVYFTDLTKANNMFSYLFDFKCNQIFITEIDDADILKISVPADAFEKHITQKMNDNVFVEMFQHADFSTLKQYPQKYICLVSSQTWAENFERYFICSLEDNKIDKVFLSEDQIDKLDDLLEIEDKKDLYFFEEVIRSMEDTLRSTLDYQQLKKVILKYASERNLDEFDYSFASFMKPNKKIYEVIETIHTIEKQQYDTFAFEEVIEKYYQEEGEEEPSLGAENLSL